MTPELTEYLNKSCDNYFLYSLPGKEKQLFALPAPSEDNETYDSFDRTMKRLGQMQYARTPSREERINFMVREVAKGTLYEDYKGLFLWTFVVWDGEKKHRAIAAVKKDITQSGGQKPE